MGRTVEGHGAPEGERPQSRQGPLPAPTSHPSLARLVSKEASPPDAPVAPRACPVLAPPAPWRWGGPEQVFPLEGGVSEGG